MHEEFPNIPSALKDFFFRKKTESIYREYSKMLLLEENENGTKTSSDKSCTFRQKGIKHFRNVTIWRKNHSKTECAGKFGKCFPIKKETVGASQLVLVPPPEILIYLSLCSFDLKLWPSTDVLPNLPSTIKRVLASQKYFYKLRSLN